MTTYTQRQIMLSFAYLAYADQKLTSGSPTLDAQIKADVINAMPNIPPISSGWSVVWGPVTYTVPGALYQDNMMFVAQTPVQDAGPQYVVAIRGTNGAVELDWLLEDFDVLQVLPWPIGATGSSVVGNISESTSIGLYVLLNMQDPDSGQTLMQFLTDQMANAMGSPVELCFTGHSLGSALASTLALYMRDNQAQWDPGSFAVVTTVNFAGPSAGDSGFASYFNQQFAYSGETNLPSWTPPDPNAPSYADCVRASFDAIPLAWNATTLDSIPGLYRTGIITQWIEPPVTSEVIGYIVKATSANDYTQIEAQQAALEVPFITKENLPSNLSSDHFIGEVQYQHSYSYPCALGVPELLTAIPGTPGFGSDAACAPSS